MKDEYCGPWIPEELKEDFIREFANREYKLRKVFKKNER